MLTERGEALLRALPHSGAPELRRALARHLYTFRGIQARPEQIVVGAGTEYLYNLIVQLLGREKVYGLEDPGYAKAERVYRLNGARCLSLPVDSQGVPLEALEEGLDVLHISPNHQFPTGVVTPIARRQGMLRWAEGGGYIIEDDYDSEFRFTGYLVLPQTLVGAYREKLGFYSCTVPAIEQYTLAAFLEEGRFDAHISRMRTSYRSQRDAILRTIRSSPLGGRCRVLREEAGLHFLLELDTEPHTLIVSYPGLDPEQLSRGLEQVAGLL